MIEAVGPIHRPRSPYRQRRDRRARIRGLVYLLAGAVAALAHDWLSTLGPGRFVRDCEHIAVAAMLVLCTLGVLLLIEGGRLLDEPHGPAGDRRIRNDVRHARAEKPRIESSLLDTRAGVAMLYARRAIGGAATRPSSAGAGPSDRRDAG